MMKKRYSWLWLGVVAIVLLVALLLLVYGSRRERQAQATDAPLSSLSVATPQAFKVAMPDLALQTIGGETVRLRELEEKVVVVNFWATWCPPCRREMPDLAQLQRDFAADGVVVLAINAGEAPDLAAAYVDELGLPFDVLLDPDLGAMTAFNVVSLPTTFFIGRDGTIDERYAGMLTRSQMDERVLALR